MNRPDEFAATKQLVELLEPFDQGDRERILRWARDKLGMVPAPVVAGGPMTSREPVTPSAPEPPMDIRSFIQTKNPRTDTQLVAVVAYFHRFVAPERKETISKEDVLSACRLAQRARPPRLDQTMVNAYHAGYFDRAERGQYKLNSVGENLVAVALPGAAAGEAVVPPRVVSRRNNRKGTRKGAKKAKRASRK